MEIQRNDGVWEEIKLNDYKTKMSIDYKLEETTSRKYISFDRGMSSDKYACELVFRKDHATIENLITIFVDLREANKAILLRGFEEDIFGDHIDHSGTITCVLETNGMDIQNAPVFNVMEFSVEVIAVDYPFVDRSAKPSLTCLQSNWKGGRDFNVKTQMTYGGSFYTTNSMSDHAEFKGSYIISNVNCARLLAYWVWQRGREFVTTSQEWGTDKMFGVSLGDTHQIVIKSVDIERISPILRQVTITLYRQGDK